MQALILAGGKGIRLRPLTLHTPKPIVPIANRPFLLYQIDLLKRAGITDIILSLSYQPKKIEDVLGDGSDFGVHIRYVVEPQPLGTAGAFKNAEEFIKGSTVVFNGDILTDLDLEQVLAQHRTTSAEATIVVTRANNPSAYGVVELGEATRVRRYMEKPKPEEITTDTINAGIYVLEPAALRHIPVDQHYSFEYGLFPELVQHKLPFHAFTSDAYWMDIGAPQRYLAAHFDVLAEKLNSYRLPDRERGEKIDREANLDQHSLVDASATIKAGVHIINSVIGPNCFIEEKARVQNSVIWSGSRIDHNAEVMNSVIGKSCIIGREVEIQSGVVLGDKSILSDYTQIK